MGTGRERARRRAGKGVPPASPLDSYKRNTKRAKKLIRALLTPPLPSHPLTKSRHGFSPSIPKSPSPYSRRPATDEQVLRVAPDFPLAIEAIRVVQEWFPGTSAGDAWEFIQQLTHLVRADVRGRRRNLGPEEGTDDCRAQGRPTEGDPSSNIPEDSPMPDAT